MTSLLFEIRASPGAGLGVFATRAIPPGTLLLSEPPLLHIPLAPAALTDAAIDHAVSSLSPAATNTLLSLSSPPLKNPSVAARIYRGNAVSPTPTSTAVYATLARVNHSCAPNASLTFTPTTPPTATLFSAHPIPAGAEILFAYLDNTPYMPRSYRRFLLHLNWRFDCLCPACSLPAADAARSDASRARAYELLARLRGFGLPQVSIRSLRARGVEVEDIHGTEEAWAEVLEGIWQPPRGVDLGGVGGWAGVEEAVGAWVEVGEIVEREGGVAGEVGVVREWGVEFMVRLLGAGMVGEEGLRTAEGRKVVPRECAERGLRAWVEARGEGHADVVAFRERMVEWAKVAGYGDGRGQVVANAA